MPISKQLTVVLENKPGALAELCTELSKLAVNITAIMAPESKSQTPLRMVTSSHETAKRVLTSMNLKFTEESVLTLRVSDRPGSLGRLTRKLAENEINIEYIYGSIVKGMGKALIVVAVSDNERAAKLV
ncbi:MAG: ACT domain-containing protein [Acidobacteriia bacterium]|nr:ACT domain-containing protein [Terriglobia bacterium]